jgi:hypothetical protein
MRSKRLWMLPVLSSAARMPFACCRQRVGGGYKGRCLYRIPPDRGMGAVGWGVPHAAVRPATLPGTVPKRCHIVAACSGVSQACTRDDSLSERGAHVPDKVFLQPQPDLPSGPAAARARRRCGTWHRLCFWERQDYPYQSRPAASIIRGEGDMQRQGRGTPPPPTQWRQGEDDEYRPGRLRYHPSIIASMLRPMRWHMPCSGCWPITSLVGRLRTFGRSGPGN